MFYAIKLKDTVKTVNRNKMGEWFIVDGGMKEIDIQAWASPYEVVRHLGGERAIMLLPRTIADAAIDMLSDIHSRALSLDHGDFREGILHSLNTAIRILDGDSLRADPMFVSHTMRMFMTAYIELDAGEWAFAEEAIERGLEDLTTMQWAYKSFASGSEEQQ